MSKSEAANILAREDACLRCPRLKSCKGCTYDFEVTTHNFSEAVATAIHALLD